MTYVVRASEATVVTLVVTPLVPIRPLISIDNYNCGRGDILNIQVPLTVSASVHGKRSHFVVEAVADFCGVGRLKVKVGHTGSGLGPKDQTITAEALFIKF